MTGVQAIGRLLVEQHARDARAALRTATFVSGYRGSPLGGLDRTLASIPGARERHEIHLVPGLNEELAATAVWGSQVVLPGGALNRHGVIGVWYGKSPGVDRAGDAMRHGNIQGANPRGGVLVLAADDPAGKSSTLPCASERTLSDYGMPVLYPRNAEEIIAFGLLGIAMSRVTGLWVGIKVTADVADGVWSVDNDFAELKIVSPEIEWNGKPWQHVQAHAATLPWSRDAEEQMVGPRCRALLAFVGANPIDSIEVDPAHARLGIVAPGKTFDDTVQALEDTGLSYAGLKAAGIRLLRLGLISPLEPGVVSRFSAGLETILVVEEKRSFVEAHLRELLYDVGSPVILGKTDRTGGALVPAYGELTANVIAEALRRVLPGHLIKPPLRATSAIPELSVHRTSYFCSGCPHNRSTVILEGSLAGGGIGCHAMALRMPQNEGRMTGITQMGGEGAQWIGQALFTDTPHLFQNMGDGTFFHSGQLAIQACIASRANITFKLLFNSAVAMTGGQDVDGSITVPALTRKLAAEGVSQIIVCAENPKAYGLHARFAKCATIWSRDRLEEAERLLRDTEGVTVLIYDQICAAEARRLRKRGRMPPKTTKVVINERVCEGCGDCGVKSNCLSLQPVATEFGRKTRIDHSSCNLDYSCIDGDCPSFMTVELDTNAPLRKVPAAPDVGSPVQSVAKDVNELLLAGIGGTGVVTVNQVLAVAAQIEGLHVVGLDQTGLSQKAGPVTSHLRISSRPIRGANRVSARGADTYLVFDTLVGAEHGLLVQTDSSRTKAAVSTSVTPTGAQVRDTAAPNLDQQVLIERIRSSVACTSLIDTLGVANRLFGSTASANILLVGAAYQMGALPMRAESIEAAIVANKVAIEVNLAAFRWGRALAENPDALRVSDSCGPLPDAHRRGVELLANRSFTGETRRLASVRAAHIERYQSRRTADQYLAALERVWSAERRVGQRTTFSEAAACGLHRVMTYKDEYEVARLLVDPSSEAQVRRELGDFKHLHYKLEPPFLRWFGLKRKISLSTRWKPLLRALAAGRRLRGTFFDPFARAETRRMERAVAASYASMIAVLATDLQDENYDRAVQAAEAANLIRGYERVKRANISRFYARIGELAI